MIRPESWRPWPSVDTAGGDPTDVITLGDASPLGFLNLTADGRVLQRSTRVQEILRPALGDALELDDFKGVDNRHGHAGGDAVLVEAGRRLLAAVRREDSVCHFGGDELLVLCERVEHADELEAVARRVVAAFEAPMDIDGTEVAVGVSVGAALAEPGDVADPDRLLRRADRARYRTKAGGGTGPSSHR